jgi:hypothetical protein
MLSPIFLGLRAVTKAARSAPFLVDVVGAARLAMVVGEA